MSPRLSTSLRRRVLGTVAGTALLLGSPLLAASASPSAAPAAAPRSAAAATSHKLFVVEGGGTTLALDPATAKVLAANGVSVALAAEARTAPGGITFPISGGLVTPGLVGSIKHTGGLTFRAGGKQLTVRNFIINTTNGRLTAYVDQVRGRIPLLDISLIGASVAAKGNVVIISNVKATLDPTAAKALDGYFGTTLFAGGLPIGTARVRASVLAVTS